jgi:hypothetical protein
MGNAVTVLVRDDKSNIEAAGSASTQMLPYLAIQRRKAWFRRTVVLTSIGYIPHDANHPTPMLEENENYPSLKSTIMLCNVSELGK